MKWLELKIDAAPAGLDPVSALLEDLGITGLVIDDEGDFRDFLEHNRAYWDYVDDALMQEKRACAVLPSIWRTAPTDTTPCPGSAWHCPG